MLDCSKVFSHQPYLGKEVSYSFLNFVQDRMAEWLRHGTSEHRILGLNPAQVNNCQTIIPGLGGLPGRTFMYFWTKV